MSPRQPGVCTPHAVCRPASQLHSPEFASTLLYSSANGKTFMAALDDLESRFPKAGPGSRAATIKAYLKYLRHRLQAPQWVCVASAPAPGCSAQRRMPLAEVQQQVLAPPTNARRPHTLSSMPHAHANTLASILDSHSLPHTVA